MLILKVYGEEIECDRVEKGADSLTIYLDGNDIRNDSGITDFSFYSLTDEQGNPVPLYSLEQLRAEKLQVVNAATQQAIYDGITIEDNTFSLSEVDQINISTLAAQLQAAMKGEPSTIDLTKGVPYHADGELCRYWPPEEFAAIAQTATAHVFYHQTYCNHLRQYIKSIVNYDELEAVQYGMELPPEFAASLAALVGV